MKRRNGLLLALLSVVLAQPLSACWQVSRPPIKLTNNHINVRFAYVAKPLDGALVLLRNQKHGFSLQIKVEKDGWVRFPAIPAGIYKLIVDGPSHESFDVVLDRSAGNAQAIFISFSEDYCSSVSLRNDPMFWKF